MRKLLLAATAIVAVGAATPALADCNEDLQTLNDKISSVDSNYRVALTGDAASDVRTLRSAARIFAANGMEDACEDTVASIDDLIDQRREKAEEEGMTMGSWSEQEVERLKGAVPVTQRSKALHAADVVGADVRNMKNEDLGEIQDVVMDPRTGELSYAILAHGGFLGLGENQIAVPWQQLKVTDSSEAPVFVLNISDETLDEAPSFDRDSWAEIDNNEWRQSNDRFYQQHSN
jgi:sporulation protein YlmC with PRC-barrel domain